MAQKEWEQDIQEWVEEKKQDARNKEEGEKRLRENLPPLTVERKRENIQGLLDHHAGEIAYLEASPAESTFNIIAEMMRSHYGRVDVVKYGTSIDNTPEGVDIARFPLLEIRFEFSRKPNGLYMYDKVSCMVDTWGEQNDHHGLKIVGRESHGGLRTGLLEEQIGLATLYMLEEASGTAIAAPVEYPEFYSPVSS